MQRSFRYLFVSTSLIALPWSPALADDAADAEVARQGTIIITGRLEREDGAATGLPLTIRETPQSVTLIDQERISDFALNNVNDLLDQVVGINVERVETDRTYYNSRGFDITNFQLDGIGLPLRWGIQFGDLDTALFETVQAVRGANAIMTGVGNPSATINYVRKRPTEELQASISGSIGSWNDKRLDTDISVPLTPDGKLAARLIYAHEDRDSYLDYNHVDRDVYSAMIAWEALPGLKLTAGYSRQDNDAQGVLWGALPLNYTDGSRVDYPVSASTSADWTYWNVSNETAFGELAYAIGGWEAKAVYTYMHLGGEAKLLYAFGYPEKDSGLGVTGVTGIYPDDVDSYLADFYASGPLTLFGREHSLAFGLSTGTMHSIEAEGFSDAYIAYPDVRDWGWGKTDLPMPDYPDPEVQEDMRDRLTRAYASAHINLADGLKGVAGVSAMWISSSGMSYGEENIRNDSKFSPYLGLVFDVTRNVSLYASYTDIFNPQTEVDVNHTRLAPALGTSLEAGIKSEWFGGRLLATAALFRAKQTGLASYAGSFDDGKSYYEGIDTTSQGFELELAGRITDNWTLSGGYTGLKVEDATGAPARTFVPRKSFKLATTYGVPQLNDLKFGAQLRWQNAIRYIDSDIQYYGGGVTGDVVVTQGAYAVVDLMAGIDLIDHVRASVNVRNVTDSKYLGSLQWGQAFYAAPRSATVTLAVKY